MLQGQSRLEGVEEADDAAYLVDRIDDVVDTIDPIVGRRSRQLRGNERQRLSRAPEV